MMTLNKQMKGISKWNTLDLLYRPSIGIAFKYRIFDNSAGVLVGLT
jgi:hypothetical protein